MKTLKKWLLYCLYTIIALPLLGVIYQQTMSFVNAKEFPAPGTFASHKTINLHVVCEGKGSPVVFFETGLGSDSLETWSTIANTVAKKTKACFYDRAGYGWSDSANTPRNRENLASELKTAINHVRGNEPVILVSHSFGGPITRAYANANQDTLKGLIFIDTNHENQSNLFPAELLPNGDDALRYYGPYFGVARLLASSFVLPNPSAPEGTHARLLERFSNAKFHHAVLGEINGEKAASAPVSSIGYNFSDIPIITLSRDPLLVQGAEKWLVEIESQWAELQMELAGLSNQVEHRTIPGAGHNIPASHPKAIITAIDDMMKIPD